MRGGFVEAKSRFLAANVRPVARLSLFIAAKVHFLATALCSVAIIARFVVANARSFIAFARFEPVASCSVAAKCGWFMDK